MSFNILGIGTAVPGHPVAQDIAARWALALYNDGQDRGRLLKTLYRRAGVRYRHSVLLDSSEPDETRWKQFYPPAAHHGDRGPTTRQRMERFDAEAGPLATVAARRALLDATVPAGDITHLITVSCTGFAAPGVDMELIDTLGLCPGVARTHVGFMGCHGALNALRTAGAFTTEDPEACVLVCSVELCTLHQQYEWSPDNVVSNALFADGSAAVVGCGDSTRMSPDSSLGIRATGSVKVPESSESMTWNIGNHGFEMSLSAQVPEVIRDRLSAWFTEWLSLEGMSIDRIGSWAIHPGGPRILSACAEALGLDAVDIGPSTGVLEDYGNMSSPTILFIVERLRRRRAPPPWVLLGFGPGLAIEAMLLGPVSPAFVTGFRREESETPSEQGARPEGTGGVLDGTSRSPTKRNAALADGSGAVADNS